MAIVRTILEVNSIEIIISDNSVRENATYWLQYYDSRITAEGKTLFAVNHLKSLRAAQTIINEQIEAMLLLVNQNRAGLLQEDQSLL